MKKALIALIGGCIYFTACNDKPEAVQPANGIYLDVYPNPAASVATVAVRTQNNSPYTVKVFDPKGDLVIEERSPGSARYFMVQLDNKPKGRYQVVLQAGESVTTQNLLKL